jgi:hypothetical protein
MVNIKRAPSVPSWKSLADFLASTPAGYAGVYRLFILPRGVLILKRGASRKQDDPVGGGLAG